MNKALATIVLPQIDEVLAKFEDIQKRHKYDDYSDIDEAEASEFIIAGIAAIHRAAGPNSQYAVQITEAFSKITPYHNTKRIPLVGGALRALRAAVNEGYLDSVQERIHASVFADFLEMARYLLVDGFKDPAAVIIGGVLEEHLRKLCTDNGIPLDMVDAKGNIRPKKAEAMNTDLAGNGIYSVLDQKNVTAWLDLRNKAAHGRYSEYTSEQVEILSQSVSDFVARHPA